MPKNILFSFKKVKKHTILAGQGGQETMPMLRVAFVKRFLEVFGEKSFEECPFVNFINILNKTFHTKVLFAAFL